MDIDLNFLLGNEVIIYSSQPYEIKGILFCENVGHSPYEVTDFEKNELVGFWVDSIQKIEGNKIFLKTYRINYD